MSLLDDGSFDLLRAEHLARLQAQPRTDLSPEIREKYMRMLAVKYSSVLASYEAKRAAVEAEALANSSPDPAPTPQ
jgi:hypothetical protein